MPLKKGSSSKVVSSNISKLMGEYKESGKIGTSIPKNKKKAHKQAIAISLSKAKETKPGTKKYKKKGKKFKNFVESLFTPENQSLMESIEKGFDAIFETHISNESEALEMEDVPMITHTFGMTKEAEIARRFELMQKIEGHEGYPIKLNDTDYETVEKAAEEAAFDIGKTGISPWNRVELAVEDLQNLLKALYVYWEQTNDENAFSLRTGILSTLRIEEI